MHAIQMFRVLLIFRKILYNFCIGLQLRSLKFIISSIILTIFYLLESKVLCSKLAEMFELMCTELGVPIQEKRNEGPCTRLPFWELIPLISHFISDNKVAELQSKLSSITSSKIVSLKYMESLCGSHNLCQGHAWQNGF